MRNVIMKDIQCINRLIGRIHEFIRELDRLRTVKVHQHIDQAYYMEKVAELQVVYDRLAELAEQERALYLLVEGLTPALVENWKRDKRWLMRHGDAYEKARQSG